MRRHATRSAVFGVLAAFLLAGCAGMTPKRTCFFVLKEATLTMQEEAIFFSTPEGQSVVQAHRDQLKWAADALDTAYHTARPLCEQGLDAAAATQSLESGIAGVQVFLPTATVTNIKQEAAKP